MDPGCQRHSPLTEMRPRVGVDSVKALLGSHTTFTPLGSGTAVPGVTLAPGDEARPPPAAPPMPDPIAEATTAPAATWRRNSRRDIPLFSPFGPLLTSRLPRLHNGHTYAVFCSPSPRRLLLPPLGSA
jgi:hypothetical protein